MSNQVDPAVHGALDFAELEKLGIHPDDVLDFSVNSNPYGPSPLILEAIQSVPIERYPDRESIALRRALSERLTVSSEQILVGNGTAELIQLAAFTFLKMGENVLILEPTFGEYERSARLMNADINRWQANQNDGFVLDIKEIQRDLDEYKPKLVFICNPNNPTGQILPLEILNDWAGVLPETLFLIDEAYLAFVNGMKSTISLRRKNILTLRSMTKDHAIAGLRLGYAVGDENIIDTMRNFRPVWNVNALAQAAGLAALQDEAYLMNTIAKLREEKDIFVSKLKQLSYQPVPSHTNYFLLPVENGAQFRHKLLKQGILIRDCASFGLPSYVRIATRKSEENTRLIDTLSQREMAG